MKQVVIQGGEARVVDVPAPQAGPRNVLVRVAHSAISAGTETAGVQAAAEPLYRRALRQPEKIRRAIEMMHERGLRYTLERARGTANVVPLGYSAAGTVIAVGGQVDGFAIGDRVACAGAGVANHAEFIDVPVNLAVRIPEGLGTDLASTVALGAIALQGVRRASAALGETVLVVGLGLLGQITVQLLRASGCRTIGADPDRARVEAALAAGMNAAVEPGPEGYTAAVQRLTDGYGADAAIVSAATPAHEVINQAIAACRRKGRVVLVGDVGLHLDRDELYRKELDFFISTSYGPGRYDPAYEEAGEDYPLPYVRWTENRNMDAYLRLLASGRIDLDRLSRAVWPVADAAAVYAKLRTEGSKPLLTLLEYPLEAKPPENTILLRQVTARREAVRIGLVGAGSFAQAVHIPNLRRLGPAFELRAVMSRTGTTASALAGRCSAAYATTDYNRLLADPEIDLVFIATRHHLHAELALAALQAGKHVFVEKPLALTATQLEAIERFYAERENGPLLLTGFNRRFSPAMTAARAALVGRTTPLVVNYRVNAGYVPPEHWVHGEEGGGRNIGEACHIYDLFNFLSRADFASVQAVAATPASRQWRRDDNFTTTIRYADGSICTLTYTALGPAGYPKERMEIFADGLVISLDDYRSLSITGGSHRGWKSANADKGHVAELEALRDGLKSGTWPISLREQAAATRISFLVQQQLTGAA
jgi:predicted dehydrogenase/threonine dehydrogenase-like Zn-dependent dehydrogenase